MNLFVWLYVCIRSCSSKEGEYNNKDTKASDKHTLWLWPTEFKVIPTTFWIHMSAFVSRAVGDVCPGVKFSKLDGWQAQRTIQQPSSDTVGVGMLAELVKDTGYVQREDHKRLRLRE